MRLFHPLVHEALDLCFKGSGHPEGLEGVLASPVWERLVQYYKSVPTLLAGTEFIHMLNAGPHRVGLEFCRSSGRDCAEVIRNVTNCAEKWEPNPHFLATLAYLGDELQNAAITCLPEQFEEPAVQTADWAELGLPLTPSQLAKVWHEGDIDTRIDIGSLIADVFYIAPNKKPRDKGRDILHQKPEYVLPGLFGPWDKESDHQPNCLGKALLVAAFARLASIDALIIIPARTCFRLKDCCRGELAELCLEGFSRAGVPLLQRRRKSLQRIASAGHYARNEPSWLHACIALRLDSHLWLLIDPNGDIVSILPLELALGAAHRDLELIGSVLPGLSFLEEAGDDSYEKNFHKYHRRGKYILDQLRIFAKNGFPPDATKSDIIERLIKSRLLDLAVTELLDDGESGSDNQTFKPRTPRRYKAVCLLLEHIFARSPSKNTTEKLKPKIEWKHLRSLHPSITEGLLFSKISDAAARRGLETLCYALGTRVLENLSADYRRLGNSAELVHPQCQIGGVGYFLATSVLAHVAYCLGQRTSLEVESLLCHHAFDLHRLHVVAGAGILHWKNRQRRQEALKAASILEDLPFVLPSTELILPHLQQMQLFTQFKEREVDSTNCNQCSS